MLILKSMKVSNIILRQMVYSSSDTTSNTEIILSIENEPSCPSEFGILYITQYIRQHKDLSRLHGNMSVYGCSFLTKGIKLEVVEKKLLTGFHKIIILTRLPSGLTTYITRNDNNLKSDSLPVVTLWRSFRLVAQRANS